MDRIHIKLNPGEKCWFTADQHFDHVNVMKFCDRPWNDVAMMNKALTDNWNEVVGKNDIVFLLGDFCWKRQTSSIKKKISELKGKMIYILLGNHDDPDQYKSIHDRRVQIISDTAMVFISGIDEDKPSREHEIMISHFPLATWPHFMRGTINIHGHIHSGPRSKCEVDVPGDDLILKKKLTYDAGVDNNEYKPIEIREILKILEK